MRWFGRYSANAFGRALDLTRGCADHHLAGGYIASNYRVGTNRRAITDNYVSKHHSARTDVDIAADLGSVVETVKVLDAQCYSLPQNATVPDLTGTMNDDVALMFDNYLTANLRRVRKFDSVYIAHKSERAFV